MPANNNFDWERLASVIDSGKKIALFLDYDGTLVPIRRNPSKCLLPVRLKKLLQRLSVSRDCYPVILSGRALADVKRKVGVRGIIYGGNHGFDIMGPGIRYTHPAALKARPFVVEAKRLLKKENENIKGAYVEDKKFSISLHYRSVREKNVPSVLKHFGEVSIPFIRKKKLALIRGKKVLELVPYASWDKGRAALWLLERLGSDFFPVYVGDDLTDETAFKALRNKGLTLRVGKSKKTFARHHIETHSDVKRLLDRILHISLF